MCRQMVSRINQALIGWTTRKYKSMLLKMILLEPGLKSEIN